MPYKTPGIYVKDLTVPQPSDPLLETALPAFVGHTQMAQDENGAPLDFKPFRVRDLEHFQNYFGGAYQPTRYHIQVDGENHILEVWPDKQFMLYDALQHYFDNGGGDCYIISVGSYEEVVTLGVAEGQRAAGLLKGLKVLEKVAEITLIVFPDAVLLPDAVSLGQLQQAALLQCAKLQNRFLVADLQVGENHLEAAQAFRDALGMNELKYGAAYFPWLYTTYAHEFHVEELVFWEEMDGNLTQIMGMDRFSQAGDSAIAQQHQQWVQNAFQRGRDIHQIISSTGIEGLDRYSFSPLSRFWQERWEDLRQLEREEQKTILSEQLQSLTNIAVAFPMLENQLSEELVTTLGELRTRDPLIQSIRNLISIALSVAEADLMEPPLSKTEVYETFQNLDQTPWILNANLSDIPAWEYESTGEGLTPQEVQRVLSDVIEELLRSMSSLFDESVGLGKTAEDTLFTRHPFFKEVQETLSLQLQALPPSGAVTGIIHRTDLQRGVFKAPANERVLATHGPTTAFDDHDQESFNVHPTGKSINIIRALRGRGTRVWGARTLAGNDNEWRYVPVRRFFSFVETWVKQAAEPIVFEPNDANTWMNFRTMLINFLTAQWRQGALVGRDTTEAFFVHIGLGETMTAQDILEGRMIIEIGMAVSRPAEFIVIRHICRMEEI